MKKHYLMLFIGLLVLLTLAVPAVSASTITLSSRTFSGAGETGDIDIYLDSAPNGVYGYKFNVTLDNPSVAEISGQKGSAWAEILKSVGLADWEIVAPGDAYFFVLSPDQIPEGATNVYLGTVTITSKGPGKAILSIDITSEGFQIDDALGGVVMPDIINGVVRVGPGSITVSSTPEDATIWLNGLNTGLVTPATIDNLAPGIYKVKVTLTDYQDSEEKDVEVVSAETTPVTFTLNPKTGSIFVDTVPHGAKIWLDDVDTGKVTPATLENVPVGGHWIKLTTDICSDFNWFDIVVIAGETTSRTFTLDNCVYPPGAIAVDSTPQGAKIWLGGSDTGKVTPATLENLAPGTYKVKVTLADYEDSEEKDVDVVSEITTPVAFTLKHIEIPLGAIAVDSTPQGAKIWLGGSDTGKVTPATLENLAPGTYKVKVTLADYEDSEEKDVEVVSEITTPVAFTLNPIVIPPVYAKLLVTSTPPGAKIFLNGEDKGQVTPFTFDLDADRVSVGVWKKCYLVPQVQEVTLARGETKEVTFTLEENTADTSCNFTPEFPSLLVPAVTLIGLIGAVFIVRNRRP